MKNNTKPRQRLTRQDWIDAALELLSEVGIGSVSVDQLATRLGITRGSFYHHFSDRQELLDALLLYWEEEWTVKIRDQLIAFSLDPSTTLMALMRAVRANSATYYDAPVRAWALHDITAREVVQRVDKIRLEFIRTQFEKLGFEKLDAENRARLFLYYEMVEPAMFLAASPDLGEALLEERHRFLTTGRVD